MQGWPRNITLSKKFLPVNLRASTCDESRIEHWSERKLIKRLWCGCYRARIQTAHTESRAAAHTHQCATPSTIVWPGLAHTSSLKNNKIIFKNPEPAVLIKLYSMLQAGKAQHETTGKIVFLFPASACQMSRRGYLSTGHCCPFHSAH